MQTTMMKQAQVSTRQMCMQRAALRCTKRNIVVRAEQPQNQQQVPNDPTEFSSTTVNITPESADASAAVATPVQNFAIFNRTTEAINGRAAMLGFVAAVVSEAVTHQAVWSQLAGKYANLEQVEKPLGTASLGFAMFVALIIMGTLAPKFLEGAEVDSKSNGPFTPGLENTLGRVAQLGFLGLVITEIVKGSSVF